MNFSDQWPLALLAALTILVLWTLLRVRSPGKALEAVLAPMMDEVRQQTERLERALRDELTRSASTTRQELLQSLTQFQQLLSQGLQSSNQSLAAQAIATREAQDQAARRSAQAQTEALQQLSDKVELKLTAIQSDNEKKLEQMRATVDEKLHATLEQRLGESFKQVADRLEQVHKGLGEMQTLARDVGSLSRVLTNVKTRGIYGEVQLAGLLEQVFTATQCGDDPG